MKKDNTIDLINKYKENIKNINHKNFREFINSYFTDFDNNAKIYLEIVDQDECHIGADIHLKIRFTSRLSIATWISNEFLRILLNIPSYTSSLELYKMEFDEKIQLRLKRKI